MANTSSPSTIRYHIERASRQAGKIAGHVGKVNHPELNEALARIAEAVAQIQADLEAIEVPEVRKYSRKGEVTPAEDITEGEATEEELGGAEMHTRISGLGDYLAEDDRDAIRIARDILAHVDWPAPPAAPRAFRPPRLDPEELVGIMPMDHKRPVDMKQVIGRIADHSDWLEFGGGYGPATVCGHIRLDYSD